MPSQPSILIALLRNDLRIVDHAIFHAAHLESRVASRVTHVLPVYVFDERQIELSGIEGYEKASKKEARTPVGKFWKCNVNRARFLHESLVDLQENLEKLGSGLSVYFGQPERLLPALVKAYMDKGVRVEGVWLGAENTPEEIQVQEKLEKALKDVGSALQLVDSRRTMIDRQDLPFDPKSKAMPGQYTAFRQKVEGLGDKMVRPSLPAPEKFKPLPEPQDIPSAPGAMQLPSGKSLKDILPELLKPLAAEDSQRAPERADVPYRGGLTAAGERLHRYCVGKNAPIATYKETRNGLLGTDFSTKFSAWLANGTLSPKVVFEAVEAWEKEFGANKSSYWIKFELLWRDFFSFLIERHGKNFFWLSGLGLPQQEAPKDSENVKQAKSNGTLDGYWLANDWDKGRSSDVQGWCYGRTGVPFIDANQRELVKTGYMSNRGRQNVASFFTKDMGHQDWRLGAEWFESYLLDYDVTSNYGNWQYQAGVGVDPRSARQFNIVKQGKDYDAHGEFVAHWLPELAEVFRKHNIPMGMIHHPWTVEAINKDLRANENLAVYATPHYEQGAWKGHYKREPQNEENKHGGQNGKRGGRGGHRGGRGGNRGGRGGERGSHGRGGHGVSNNAQTSNATLQQQ